MLNDYGYQVKERRTDHYSPPPMDNTYARWRQAERILSRRRVTRGELAKYLGVTPRQASRILIELSLAIPLTKDNHHRWYVMGEENAHSN